MRFDPTNICDCRRYNAWDCANGCLDDPETAYQQEWRERVSRGDIDVPPTDDDWLDLTAVGFERLLRGAS